MKKIFRINFLLAICLLFWQPARANDLQISPDEAERFNDESKQEIFDAANTALKQVPENTAQEELDLQKRGTGELFNTTIQQRQIQ